MKDLDSILKNIKNNVFQPIYFFHGEEAYYTDVAIKSLETNVLSEDEKAFNQTIVYGKDTTYQEIFSLARQFPMMGDKMLIIVKEAQDLKLGEAETEAFISYIQNPVPSTILAFAHKNKTLDGKKRKLNDLLKKNNFIFLSEKLRDSDVPKFILQQIHQLKINAAPNISSLLAEYLGRDLSRIHNELVKLKLILAENELLNDKLVEKHIGISKEYNVFELQNAIGQKNASKAMKIAYYMGQNNKVNPMALTISRLYEFFTNVLLYQTIYNFPQAEIAKELKIHPFFVKDYVEAARYYPMKFATKAISVIREIDLKSKGLGVNQTTDSELIKELVYKIINIDSIKIKT